METPIQAKQLSDLDQKVSLIIKNYLLQRIGREKSMRRDYIVNALQAQFGHKTVTTTRFKRLLKYLRDNGELKHLISTPDGYYISDSPAEIKQYRKSIEARITGLVRYSKLYVK